MYADETINHKSKDKEQYVYEELCSLCNDKKIIDSAYWYVYWQMKDNPNLEITREYLEKVIRAKQGLKEDFSMYQ